MAPRKTKKAAKTKRTPSQVKRNTRSHQTRTSPQESPSQNIYIKQEESDETLLTTPGHTTHAHLTPTHKSSSTTYKIKKSTSYPKTPLNAVQSIAMTRCRNSIRRAEFREYVRLGITPLEGKGSGIVQGGQGMTNPLVDEGGEEEIPIIQENSRNELENKELEWLRERLWGKGKWAVRSEEEEDMLFVASVLGEEEWQAIWA